ncbi:hypothetical protein [Flexithrix dorotheae]|uniref:hypothetical protein n=1 Tax=Flexithrix dorotheae TaxID=70993 RepID=UPI00036459AF|nr:hypothetical protein [Flexithrix dorotheae]
MSNKYKININKPKPSEKEVDLHKNFNRVLSQYKRSHTNKRKPMHKILNKFNRFMSLFILIIVLFLVILFIKMYILDKKENEQQTPQPEIESVK